MCRWHAFGNVRALQLGAVDAILASAAEAIRERGQFVFVLSAGSTPRGSLDTLAVLDAPNPPRERITMSAARLSRARKVFFLVSGESKHRSVAAWRAGKDIPARLIAPSAGVDVQVESALLLPLAG